MAADPWSDPHNYDDNGQYQEPSPGFDWSKLIGPGAAVGAGLAGRALSPSPQQATQAAMPPELRQLLAMSAQRAQYQNPLFQAVSQQAFQGLPTYAKQGVSMGSQLPQMPNGAGSDSGGMPDWLKYLIGAGAGSQARSMLPGAGSGSGGDLGKLVKSIAGLFHRDGTFGNPLGAGGSDPFGSNLPGYDTFGFFNDPEVFSGLPSDPSGGSGIGPGMQSYYASNGITSNGGANPWDE